jgi:hypothetical protein
VGEELAVFSAVVAIIALYFAWKSARASEKSASAAEESVNIARRSSDASIRAAEAAEKANLLTTEMLDIQRAAVQAEEEERHRLLKTKLVVDGWSGHGGLDITNVGPGPATDILAILTSPRRYARFRGIRADERERIPFRETNDWPEDFKPDSDPPPRGGDPDVAWVRWRNADGSTDETGWVRAPQVP